MIPHEPALSRGGASSLRTRPVSTWIARSAILLAVVLACVDATGGPVPRASSGARFVPDRRQLAEIEHVLATRYFRKIPRESLATAARLCLEGRLDPYSTWFDPAQRAAFHRMLAGDVATGSPPRRDEAAEVMPPGAASPPANDPRTLTSGTGPAAPPEEMLDAPADEAPFASPGDSVARSTGGAGTGVEATVLPPASPTRPRLLPAIDAEVSTRSVRGVHAAGDDAARWLVDAPGRIAYVRITRFTARTPGEMNEVLAAVNRLGARGLVLDLRGDPGGLIRSAVAVTDRFLDSGTIVAVRRRTKTITYRADREVATRIPIAVLVDGGTASAAEMMASALQDHRRAIVMGEPTYGKGAVQQVFRLKHSPGYLKLTTALYRRPSGALVEEHIAGAGGSGVHPDAGFVIAHRESRDAGGDPVLERALATLRPVAATALR